MDISGAAKTAEQLVEGFMKVEPFLATIANLVPGAAPVVVAVHPAVAMLAPLLENGLKALADGNNGDFFTALIQMAQHLTPGHANAPILSTPAATNSMSSIPQAGAGGYTNP